MLLSLFHFGGGQSPVVRIERGGAQCYGLLIQTKFVLRRGQIEFRGFEVFPGNATLSEKRPTPVVSSLGISHLRTCITQRLLVLRVGLRNRAGGHAALTCQRLV